MNCLNNFCIEKFYKNALFSSFKRCAREKKEGSELGTLATELSLTGHINSVKRLCYMRFDKEMGDEPSLS